MAGKDSPAPSPEDIIAKGLIGGDTKPQADTTTAKLQADAHPAAPPNPGAPNADKPGAAPVVADKQAGGPAAPPGDSPTPSATVADNTATPKPAAKDQPAPAPGADAKPAAGADAKPAPGADAKPAPGADAKPAATADATDKNRTPDVVAANAHGIDVMKKVNDILDKDVPGYNKSHDLANAQKSYEQAIALANTLTPQDLTQAQKDLAQVRKDKATETDPDKKRDLMDKEVALYTITRLKDAATGNMALWYYRQGKTEDGNAKLLEATGVDPDTAQKLKKMGPDEIKQYGAMLDAASSVSPILGDSNFFRQIGKITDGGVKIPDVFSKINQAVVAHNAEVAKQGGAGSDRSNPAGTDGGAAAADAPYNAAKNNADMKAFIDLNNQLKDKTGPVTADQKKVLEDGIKAYDAQNTYIGKAMDESQKALDQVLTPEKQKAYGDAEAKVNAELEKVAVDKPVTGPDGKAVNGADGKPAMQKGIPDDIQAQLTKVVGAKSPADYQAATAELAKTQPNLAKALTDASGILPQGADGLRAMSLYQQNSDLQDAFVKSSMQQILAHYSYAKILSNTGDAADKTHAKEVFTSGFNNVPKQVAQNVLGSKEAQDLGTKLGLADKPAAGAGTDQHPAGGAPGSNQAGGELANLNVQDLQKRMEDAKKKGAAGMTDVKAIYDEEIRRSEDPEKRKQFTDQLTANVTALESGKDASGKDLDAATRLQLHAKNCDLVQALSIPAQLHADYALYLGDNRLALDDPSKFHDRIQGGLNQLKSMDAEQRKAIAAADSIDASLLKRVDTQLNNDRKAGLGDDKVQGALDQMKVAMEGGKDSDGNDVIGLMSSRVVMRDQLAALYLMQGKQFKSDGSMAAIMPSTHHTDSLFKPQDALALLNDARKANEDLNGKGAIDTTTNQLMALGQSVQPDVFKSNSEALSKTGANALSDVAAMGGSMVGKTVIAYVVAAGLDAVHVPVNPAALSAISTAGALGTGILTRRAVHGLITGKSEDWSDSVVHGTAAALAPIAIRAVGRYASDPETILGKALNWRSANITGEAIVQRAASNIGPDATFVDVAKTFRASGLTTEAAQLEALGPKTVASASADEMSALSKGLNLGGARGREALIKMFPTMNGAGSDAAVLDALDARGIKTVGQLQAELDGRAAKVTMMSGQVEAGVKDSTPISSWLRDLKTGNPGAGELKPLYPTKEAIDKEAKFLADNNITNVGQLRNAGRNAASFFQVQKLFPELSGVTPETSIRSAVVGTGFGDTAGRVQLGHILDESKLGPTVTKLGPGAKVGGWFDKLGRSAGDKLWMDRVWNVSMDRPVVSMPNLGGKAASDLVAADPALAQGGVRGTLGKLKPEFNMPSMPNAQRLNPLLATARQVGIADSQTKFWAAAAATGVGMMGYNSATGLYDNWWKGTEYKGSDGQWHKYSFMGALGNAAETSVGEALIGGFLLKGTMPAALESGQAVPTSTGWLARRVPALASPEARAAVAGDGKFLRSMTNFTLFGNPTTWQGGLDLINSADKRKTYENTQKPLQDYAPDDVGTTADQVQGDNKPAPQPDSTAKPAPGTDATAKPASTDNTAAPAPGADGVTPAPGSDNIAAPDPNQDAPAKAQPDATPAATPQGPAPAAKPATGAQSFDKPPGT